MILELYNSKENKYYQAHLWIAEDDGTFESRKKEFTKLRIDKKKEIEINL